MKLLFLLFTAAMANWKFPIPDTSTTDFSFEQGGSLGRSQNSICNTRFTNFPVVLNHNNKLKTKNTNSLSWKDDGTFFNYNNAKYVCKNNKWDSYYPTHAKNIKLIFKDGNGNSVWDDCKDEYITGGTPDNTINKYSDLEKNSYACVQINNGQGVWP